MTAVPVTEPKAGAEALGGDARRQVIVVGGDGSAPRWAAFEGAVGFTAPLGYGAAADARDQVADELRGEVSRRAAELDVEVVFVRESGDAVHVLTEVARAEHADPMAVGRSATALH